MMKKLLLLTTITIMMVGCSNPSGPSADYPHTTIEGHYSVQPYKSGKSQEIILKNQKANSIDFELNLPIGPPVLDTTVACTIDSEKGNIVYFHINESNEICYVKRMDYPAKDTMYFEGKPFEKVN